MLLSLKVRNLVLVEELNLSFGGGLTILTGETGAGKTALLAALGLLFGERTDATKVRQGCDKGRVEASFSLDHPIPFIEETDVVVLAREITSDGKSKSFVSGNPVPASFLKQLKHHLMTFLSQHAHIALKGPDEQLELLDRFGKIDRTSYDEALAHERKLKDELGALVEKQSRVETEKKELQETKAAIESLGLTEGEEEELFSELSRLSNVHELLETSSRALQLSEEGHLITSQLLTLLEKLELLSMGKEAHFAFEELIQGLQSFRSTLQVSPQRLEQVEDRLKEIDRLKKLYGLDLFEIAAIVEKRLNVLGGLDREILSAEEAHGKASEETASQARKLRKKRDVAAKAFSKALTQELQALNMKGAEVSIATGEHKAEFLLKANKGESFVTVKESSSGGELSRLFFAIQLCLKDPSRPTTLFFDEIDANVGGESATAMGEKLHSIAQGQQVFCITHFPQVARFADHHFCVSKEQNKGRTVTTVRPLDSSEREDELHRMLGGAIAPGQAWETALPGIRDGDASQENLEAGINSEELM